MQIDGGAGVDVAADVGVQEEGVAPAAKCQHTTPNWVHTAHIRTQNANLCGPNVHPNAKKCTYILLSAPQSHPQSLNTNPVSQILDQVAKMYLQLQRCASPLA